MLRHSNDHREIPQDTLQLGQKLLDGNNPYRQIGEKLYDLVRDEDFADLYTSIGGPAISPVDVSFILIFQIMEKLPDRQAAEALRVRVDWKYALRRSLDDPGFCWTNLAHFRQRVLMHQAEYRVFDQLLQKVVDLGFIRRKGKQRTDSTHILGLVAKLSRLELVWETLGVALKTLQQQDETWVKQHVPEAFLQEYPSKRSDYRLTDQEVAAALKQTGADGWWLLQQMASGPEALNELPEVQILHKVWEQQFEIDDLGHYGGPRTKLNSFDLVQSPHEPEVRYRQKRGQPWKGYTAQVTETAEDKGDINFITDVGVTPTLVQDHDALPEIQQRLAERDLTPGEQYVDAAYITTTRLAESEKQGIRLIGPAMLPHQPKGFELKDFQIDLEQHQAMCPAEKFSVRWSLNQRPDGMHDYCFYFNEQCATCPLRSRCTIAKNGRTLAYHEHHAYLEARLAEMQTDAFWQAMKRRPPIEGTLSQLARQGARQSRYRGQRKANLQLIFTAIVANLKRLLRAWATGYTPSWWAESTA